MSGMGGGKDIAEVLRQLGKEALISEAEAAGLKPRSNRMLCPFEGCRHKAPHEKKDSVQIHPGKRGEYRAKCWACGKDGSLVDVLAAIRGWSDAEAIAHLHGLDVGPARPHMRLVTPEPPPADDKLKPEEIRSVWDKLATSDEAGESYLLSRSLDEAAQLGIVRFATTAHPNKKVKDWASRQRLIVALMKDVVGNARGLQARLVRNPVGREPKISSLKGSSTSRSFFGYPEFIESSPLVAVAEGLADTCALAQWASGSEVAVVGAAGKDNLVRLAEELDRCGIPVEGRIFALFPQNDRPTNKSRAEFSRLAQLLAQRGARVVLISTHDEYKDLADWLHSQPDASWPPPELAQLLGGEVEHESPTTRLVDPVRGSLPIPERIEVKSWGQNFSTLVALLDDPALREAIYGRRGELAYNEMNGELTFGGQEIDDTDISGIRLRIELNARSPEGKILKFSSPEIWDAIAFLSKRRMIHPIRDWLKSLKWDGFPRLEQKVAEALGLGWPSLEATMMRMWFVSAAARGIEPGCKVDTVLVLQGAEGISKSSFFDLMAGRDYFTASPVRIGEADGFEVLRFNWIVEWAELDSMRRARDREAVKSFVSTPVDFYRPKWAKGQQRIKRSSVIVGTTNPKGFLTGFDNRRFWPIPVTTVDFAWFAANREQIWAEAAHLFLAASSCAHCKPLLPMKRCEEHKWWFDEGDYAPLLRQHNLSFQEDDEWVGVISDWLRTTADKGDFQEAVRIHDVLEKAIGKPPGQWGPRDSGRAQEALKKLGWAPGKRRHKGVVGRWWTPPEGQSDLLEGEA